MFRMCSFFAKIGSTLVLVQLLLTAAISQPASKPKADVPPVATILPEIVRLPVIPDDDIRFRRLSLSQGLSQTRVAQIIQDDQGFIWFGTQHGVNRFDGYNFQVFRHEANRPDSLSGVFIYALFKDRSGTIWVGSDQGLDSFEKTTETFTHHPLGDPGPVVIHISQTADGLLWMATGQGLYSLNPKTGQTTKFSHDRADVQSLPSDDIKSTGEDRTGQFWVANSEGLSAFDRSTGRVTFNIPLREAVREFSFYEDRSGTFWIIYGSGNGLATFDRKTNLVTRYSFYDQEPAASGLTGVFSILETQDGTIWLATMGAGLLKFDRAQQRFISYRNQPNNLESLAENRVIALLEDAEGNVWAGLHASPPNMFPSVQPAFQSLKPVVTQPNRFGETLVNTIYEDSHKALWMGAGGALNRMDRKTGDTQTFDVLGQGVPIEVLTIMEGSADELWAGSLGNGLLRIDVKTKRLKSYRNIPGDKSSISSDIVTRLFVDRFGTMWVTTWNGLNKFDPQTSRFTLYKRDPLSSTEPYFSIVEDHAGQLWLGSTDGLFGFDPKSGHFRSFAHDLSKPSSLSNNTVNTVYVDRAGALWIGTQNGLNLMDRSTGTFKIFSQKDGLAGGVVSCILEDEEGNLWMSTNGGISRLIVSTKAFSNFSSVDGLPGNDLTGWNACYKGASGEMFFGGFAGATAFRPEALKNSTYIPPVVLTGLRLAGTQVKTLQPPLSQAIAYLGKLTLTPEQNDFTIAFSALSFASPETTRYRYRLLGLDKSWLEIDNERREVGYTTLPSGTYRFEVQAATSRGPWPKDVAALDIIMLPPWWNTWWFRTAYVTAFVLSLIAFYRFRLAQISRQYHIRFEERLSERTRIARELHDSLLQGFQGLVFSLQAVRDFLPRHPDKATQQLLKALEQADQAIVEGRDAVHDLRTPSLSASDLPQALALLGSEMIPESPNPNVSFKVIVDGHPRGLNLLIRDEIYRIAREGLRNAFRHSKAVKVECELSFGTNVFSLRIRDDGQGIDPAVYRAGSRPGHWGLPGMRERAEKFGGTLTIWSKPQVGTEIELSVPAKVAFG